MSIQIATIQEGVESSHEQKVELTIIKFKVSFPLPRPCHPLSMYKEVVR